MLIDIQNLEDEEDSKAYKQLINDYRKRAVTEVEKVCALCGKNVTSFCKSHTVPFSWLKNIDNQKKMLSMHSILESNWIKQDKGASEAGVFYSICDTCDHELFSHYENKENYKADEPTEEMLQEIVQKILVKEIYEHRIVAKQTELMKNELGKFYFEEVNDAESETYETAVKELNKFRRKWPEFRIIYFKKLPYTVPIAYQDQIAVFSDFEGNVINNTYINSDKIQVLYECILPLENESVLLLFTLSNNKRYSKFIREFQKLDDVEKQKIMLYMMFSYSQNYFISKELETIIKNDNFVRELAGRMMLGLQKSDTEFSRLQAHIRTTLETMKNYSLDKATQLENYLSKEYAVTNLSIQ